MEDRQDTYRKLQRRIDDLPIPFPKSDTGAELRLLRHLFGEEEAEIACHMSGMSETPEKIARRMKRHGIDCEEHEIQSVLDSLVERGAITAGSVKTRDGRKKGYSLMPLAIGMFEMQVDRLTPEYTKDFEEYLDGEFRTAIHSTKTGQLRTVPVKTSIETAHHIGAYDDIKSYINSVRGPFAVMNCVCRQGKDLLDESCDHSDIRETCLTIGGAAIGMSRRGNARLVKREEFLDLLDRAEKKGFVVQPQNTRNPQYICCCCGDCCELLTTAKKLPRPVEVFHSNYDARVDSDLCNGCGRCVKRCQMDAITMVDSTATVKFDRCIGCGLCVSTCPTDAMSLNPKKHLENPPRNFTWLMSRIFMERKGMFRTLGLLVRVVFKMQV